MFFGLFNNMFKDKGAEQIRSETLSFNVVPNGKYLVKYVNEKSVNDGIVIIFEIIRGKYGSTKVPLTFFSSKAKRVAKEATGDYISRLSFEGVKKAEKLELIYLNSSSYNLYNTEFLIRISDGYVVTIYKSDEEDIGIFKGQLNRNSEFIGYAQVKAKKERAIAKEGKDTIFVFNLSKAPPDKLFNVKSYNRETSYDVNIFRMSCSCPEFREVRSKFVKNDVRRLCYHLKVKLFRGYYFGEHDDLTQVVLDSITIGPKMTINYMSSGEIVAFCHGEQGTSWIDIYARKRRKGDKDGVYTGKYENYGFNSKDYRWRTGIVPAGAMEIRDMVKLLK